MRLAQKVEQVARAADIESRGGASLEALRLARGNGGDRDGDDDGLGVSRHGFAFRFGGGLGK